MQRGTKIFLGIVGGVVAIALGLFIWTIIRAKKDAAAAAGSGGATAGKTTTSGTTTPKPTPAPSTITTAYINLPDGDFPLKKGSKSRLAWLYQLYLNERYSAGLKVDGVFGDATTLASQKNVGTTEISRDKAEQLIRSVPVAKAALFVEYADLIGRKISGTLGTTVKNW